MDDITWPPKKRSELKIVPGQRGTSQTPKLRSTDFNQTRQAPPDYDQSEPLEQRVEHDEPSVEESLPPDDQAPNEHEEMPAKPPKKKRRLFYFKRGHMTKKKWALLIAIIVILIGGGGYGAFALYKHFRAVPVEPEVAKVEPTPEPPPAPTTEPSRLTGAEIAIELNKRPVTGIMIENSPDARPQAGLLDAGVVYEAIAEGGITRFLALYLESRPAHVGPVRSVRPYYLDFLMPYDAGIAHAGGSPEALADIKSLGVKDLDQFANSGSYRRVSNRFAPHNLYTDFDQMDALNAKKGFNSSTFTGFSRKKEEPAATPTAKVVNLGISSALYNVRYDYNATNNLYSRSEGGAPHRDEKSGSQLAPKVVVALVMDRGIASDGQHTKYGTTGSGKMYVFQDGTVTEGVWRKADRKAQFSFENATGGVLALNPGQTWITIVDAASDVTFTP
ncbi:MAG: DUF3048 domain-containing protein [Candidatus Saccharibacteria bacterium]|nr:DUF3048 domain-containing protein [Candidatus Saccharibacteria bacterium]